MKITNRALPALCMFWRNHHQWGPRGWVYFVHAEEGGLVKIGHTKYPVGRRLDGLQATSPIPLRLIVAVRGPLDLEQRFHGCFHDDRHHNEWFNESDDLRELFELLKSTDFVEQLGKLMDEWEVRDPRDWKPPPPRGCNCRLTVFPQLA